MAPKGEDILKGFQVYPFFAVVISDFGNNLALMTLSVTFYVAWYMAFCQDKVRLVSHFLFSCGRALTINAEIG
jgi:hypothetical protein